MPLKPGAVKLFVLVRLLWRGSERPAARPAAAVALASVAALVTLVAIASAASWPLASPLGHVAAAVSPSLLLPAHASVTTTAAQGFADLAASLPLAYAVLAIYAVHAIAAPLLLYRRLLDDTAFWRDLGRSGGAAMAWTA